MKKILVVSHERSGTHLTLNSFGENNCVNLPLGDKELVNEFLKNYEGNHILKSHHQSYFFEDFVYEKYKVVYVKRNPLDVLTSVYFYHKTNKKVFPQHDTIEKFIFDKTHNNDLYSLKSYENNLDRWITHVKSYEGKNVINVTYEEILNDYVSFKKNMEKKGIKCVDNKPILGKGQSVNPRKGIVGDHKNHMDEELINKINTLIV